MLQFLTHAVYPQQSPCLKKKLINAPTSLRDIFATNLDPKADGVPSWEQFGEKLLGMTATDLRQFKACESPTKAVLNKKVAIDPSATIEDALGALEDIGRKDVYELVLQKLESIPLAILSKQESEERESFCLSPLKPSLYRHSSFGSTISKQGSGDWESAYPSPHVQVTQRPPLFHQPSSSDSGYADTGGHIESNDSVQLQATKSPHEPQVPLNVEQPGCRPASHQATASLPIPGKILQRLSTTEVYTRLDS